jgi:hypothetical protein
MREEQRRMRALKGGGGGVWASAVHVVSSPHKWYGNLPYN